MEIAPYFADLAENDLPVQSHWLVASDGTRLRRVIWGRAQKGHVLLFPGRTEYIEKYGRMVRLLAARGYAVVCIDWRGQGLSDHVDGRRDIGHVDDFTEYQVDVAALLADPAVAALPGPRLLFAHSMGGCVGLRALLGGMDVAGAVFSGPMWGISVNRYLKPVGEALAIIGARIGQSRMRMPGTSGAAYVISDAFEGNVLTHDQLTWNWLRAQVLAQPDLALGGPTFGWVDAARKEFVNFASAIMPETPSLTILGGDETVVDTAAVRRLMARFKNGKLIEIPGARHEIWMERAAQQDMAWREIDAFLQKVTP